MIDETTKRDDEIGREAGRFAEKLQQDVRIWSANEDQASDRHDDAAQALADKQIKASADGIKKRGAAKVVKAAAAAAAPQKPGPFSMSYGGQSVADHLKARRTLGAR